MNFRILKIKMTFVFALLLTGVMAQQNSFIYIQTENQKPFYVKFDKRYLNSSATGYIIIPGLTESSYKLSFGFPKSSYPEREVLISMKQANEGFVLKENDSETWVLVNLQTNQKLISGRVSNNSPASAKKKTENEFARILADVVNDPSIAWETTNVQPIDINLVKLDTGNTKPADLKAEIVKVETVKEKDSVTVKNSIVKLNTDSTHEGLHLIYLDKLKKETDTVDVFISVNGPVAKTPISKSQDIATKKENSISATTGDARFINMELQNPNAKKDSADAARDFVITEKKQKTMAAAVSDSGKITTSKSGEKGMINTDCKKVASENEFLKLRKSMAAASGESAMTRTAIKDFTSYCFTTDQIKNLGVLFLMEEERYKFFVAAYPYVSDTHNFPALEEQLTDEYYINRFKAMVTRN